MSAPIETQEEGLLSNLSNFADELKSRPAQPTPGPTEQLNKVVVDNTSKPEVKTEPVKEPVKESIPEVGKTEPKTFNPLDTVDDQPQNDGAAAPDPVEKEVEEKYKIDDKASEPAKLNFQSLKTELKDLKRNGRKADLEKITELSKQIEEIQKKTPTVANTPDLEVLKNERDTFKAKYEEVDKALSKLKVEYRPEFQETVVKPIKQITERLTTAADKYKIDAKELISAFSEADPFARAEKLEPLLENLSQTKVDALVEIGRSLADKVNLRDLALKESETALKVFEDQQRNQARTIEAQTIEQQKLNKDRYISSYQAESEKVLENLAKEIPLFRKFDGQDEFNKNVDKLKSVVKGLDFTSLSLNDQALMASYSLAFPQLYNYARDMAKKAATLEAAMAKRSGTTPGAGSGMAVPASENTPKKEEGGFIDAIDKAVRAQGGR